MSVVTDLQLALESIDFRELRVTRQGDTYVAQVIFDGNHALLSVGDTMEEAIRSAISLMRFDIRTQCGSEEMHPWEREVVG